MAERGEGYQINYLVRDDRVILVALCVCVCAQLLIESVRKTTGYLVSCYTVRRPVGIDVRARSRLSPRLSVHRQPLRLVNGIAFVGDGLRRIFSPPNTKALSLPLDRWAVNHGPCEFPSVSLSGPSKFPTVFSSPIFMFTRQKEKRIQVSRCDVLSNIFPSLR